MVRRIADRRATVEGNGFGPMFGADDDADAAQGERRHRPLGEASGKQGLPCQQRQGQPRGQPIPSPQSTEYPCTHSDTGDETCAQNSRPPLGAARGSNQTASLRR